MGIDWRTVAISMAFSMIVSMAIAGSLAKYLFTEFIRITGNFVEGVIDALNKHYEKKGN